MSISKLLAASTLRVKTVTIPGVGPIRIREPSYALMTKFREDTAAGKTRDATANLFSECVVSEDGSGLSTDDAYKIVDGSLRVLNPLMAAITESLAENAKNV